MLSRTRLLLQLSRYIPINHLKLFLMLVREHEDIFWSIFAQFFLPTYKIPSIEKALSFAFECQPEYCLKINEGKLPFGCHAWNKYNRKFWIEHICQNSKI